MVKKKVIKQNFEIGACPQIIIGILTDNFHINFFLKFVKNQFKDWNVQFVFSCLYKIVLQLKCNLFNLKMKYVLVRLLFVDNNDLKMPNSIYRKLVSIFYCVIISRIV